MSKTTPTPAPKSGKPPASKEGRGLQGRDGGLASWSPGAPERIQGQIAIRFPFPFFSFFFFFFFSYSLSFFLFSFFSLHSPSSHSNSSFLAPAPVPPWGPPFTRSTGRDKSSLSSSRAGSPRAYGPSCASAWRRGWGSTPCRWYTGRVRRRCVFSGA